MVSKQLWSGEMEKRLHATPKRYGPVQLLIAQTLARARLAGHFHMKSPPFGNPHYLKDCAAFNIGYVTENTTFRNFCSSATGAFET